jgi:hypothetical protein
MYLLLTMIMMCSISSLINNYRSGNHSNEQVTDRNLSNFIERRLILVPLHIDRLYEQRVLCSGVRAIVNRTDLFKQLSNECQIDFNRTLPIDLHPPDDFQIRSNSTMKYQRQWTINESCSILTNETVAIVISYRDRYENLRTLLFNLIPLLTEQKISNYRIFLIEQQTSDGFNKGRLYNIAFTYLMKTYKPSCIIFHGKYSRRSSSEFYSHMRTMSNIE